MLARLIRKAEECEKGKRARDNQPVGYFEGVSHISVILPNEAWDLDDHGIVAVSLGPAYPRCDTFLRIIHDKIRPQRNGPEYPGGRKGRQAEVPATTETLGRRHYLPELTLVHIK
jgi:hypothetical protein